MLAICVCIRDEVAPLKDTVGDISKDSSPPTTSMACDIESLAVASASSSAETVTSSANCSRGGWKNDSRLDGASALATSCLNMDDIMEYLQCQDVSLLDSTAQNVLSMNASLSNNFMSDSNNPVMSISENSTSSALSLAALQQLASECSTIDLSSLGTDSNVPFVGSNGPTAGQLTLQLHIVAACTCI